MLTKEEMQGWLRSGWNDLPGASTTRSGHPAPYPVEVAERLIRLFSFAGDTILDPFMGTASTNVAALNTGRNSIGVEIEPIYMKVAQKNIKSVARVRPMAGATSSEVTVD
jgi:site-specific DNA-methyltransferase (adenine-specific)